MGPFWEIYCHLSLISLWFDFQLPHNFRSSTSHNSCKWYWHLECKTCRHQHSYIALEQHSTLDKISACVWKNTCDWNIKKNSMSANWQHQLQVIRIYWYEIIWFKWNLGSCICYSLYFQTKGLSLINRQLISLRFYT